MSINNRFNNPFNSPIIMSSSQLNSNYKHILSKRLANILGVKYISTNIMPSFKSRTEQIKYLHDLLLDLETMVVLDIPKWYWFLNNKKLDGEIKDIFKQFKNIFLLSPGEDINANIVLLNKEIKDPSNCLTADDFDKRINKPKRKGKEAKDKLNYYPIMVNIGDNAPLVTAQHMKKLVKYK